MNIWVMVSLMEVFLGLCVTQFHSSHSNENRKNLDKYTKLGSCRTQSNCRSFRKSL